MQKSLSCGNPAGESEVYSKKTVGDLEVRLVDDRSCKVERWEKADPCISCWVVDLKGERN